MASIGIAFLLVLLSLGAYWLYKKIRSPAYKPGMVAKLMSESPEIFDMPAGGGPEATSTTAPMIWKIATGVDIFYFPPRIKSSTKSIALALHGGPSIAPDATWTATSKIPNVYLYHARGCGYSTRPLTKFPTQGMWPGIKLMEEALGIAMQLGDIERIRRHLTTADSKIDLIGHSFGGFLATLYAAEFPEKIRSLTLLVPAACLVLPPQGGQKDLFLIVKEKLQEEGETQIVQEYETFVKDKYLNFSNFPEETEESLTEKQLEFAKYYYRAAGVADEHQKPIDQELVGGMALFATFMSMGLEHNYIAALKERLHHTEFPVLIVHGAKDIVPSETSRQYVDLFPAGNATFRIADNGDHDLFDLPEVGAMIESHIDF